MESSRPPSFRGRAPRRPRPPVPLSRPARGLARVFRDRRRALHQLGVRVPPELARGPATTLPQRLDAVERRIALELELAGGKRLPAWDPEDDPFEEDEDPASPLT